jgi:uncharacterized coiled-coil DUF342 family protein
MKAVASMEHSVDRLETKVLEAIALIKDLRQKNQQLVEQCAGLQDKLTDIEEQKNRLELKLEAANDMASTADELEAKRQVIDDKLSSLLEKLEAMG